MQRANANMAIQHPRFIVLLTPIAKYSSVEPIRSDLVWKNFQFGIPSITHHQGVIIRTGIAILRAIYPPTAIACLPLFDLMLTTNSDTCLPSTWPVRISLNNTGSIQCDENPSRRVTSDAKHGPIACKHARPVDAVHRQNSFLTYSFRRLNDATVNMH